MSEKFPHLNDNIKFPGVSSVDPYRIKQGFDYTRWEPGTKLKLCNVNWCSDYENVVKFDSDAARDSYFDALETPIHVLESGMRVFPKQEIKLPVPFDELVNYNSSSRPLRFRSRTSIGAASSISLETLSSARRIRRVAFLIWTCGRHTLTAWRSTT